MKTASKRETGKPRHGWVAMGVGAVVVVAGLWLSLRSERPLTVRLGISRAERLSCQPDEGFSRSYRLSVTTELQLNAAALIADPRSRGRLLSSSAGYDARLRVRALSRRGDARVLALQVDEVEPTSGAGASPSPLTAELEKPFFVVLGTDCRITEAGFSPELSAEAINRQQALVNGLSLVVSQTPGDREWTAKEHDSVGEYTARYSRAADAAPGSFVKERTAYLSVHPPVGQRFKEQLLVRILGSTSPATLDEQHAWLTQLESKEHFQVTRADGSLVTDVKSSLALERDLQQQTPLEVAMLPELRWRSDHDAPLLAEVRQAEPPDAMKTMALEDAMAQYSALLRASQPGGVGRAANFLALLLRAQPGLAFELMAMLQRQEIAPDLESTVFLALELSGTPESQAALIEGLSDEHAARNRSRAAAALPDVPNPSPATLTALAETAREAQAETKDETRLVRNSAVYALGALEGRTRSKNTALADQTLATIRARLGKVESPSDLTATLDAIGNSGNADFIPDLKPHLEARDALVRTHAIQAMGHMDPEANKTVFRQLIVGEQDPKIRGAIAQTYADQARRADTVAPPEVVQGALAVLGREPDPRVRGQLIDLIGPACASDPQAMQALAAQFKQETEPMLMKAIGRYVPANKLGS